MRIERDLILRYSKQLPRYTSYPTALEFTPQFTEHNWRNSLLSYIESNKQPSLSLYCHIPFCRSLCYFCACNKIITKTRDEVRPYLTGIIKEIGLYSSMFGESASISQLHWGGGSPNFLNPAEIAELFTAIKNVFPNFLPDADISIELDPRTTMSLQLKTLRDLGFHRISLGVQDFAPEVQSVINRVQSFESTELLCNEARNFGFKSINLDLIYGLPLQTIESFQKTLKLVESLRPDRIALYGYAHVSWKSKTQRVFDKLPLPEAKERLELFCMAVEFLVSRGYEYIGMDHFALPGDDLFKAYQDGTLHRNFMGYTTHKNSALLGFGVSAISTLPDAFSQNNRSIKEYLEKIKSGHFPIERGVTRSIEDKWRGALIQEIMCRGRIDRIKFQREWGITLNTNEKLLEDPLKDSLIEVSSDEISVTKLGRFFLRNIASGFDSYRREDKAQKFSQTL